MKKYIKILAGIMSVTAISGCTAAQEITTTTAVERTASETTTTPVVEETTEAEVVTTSATELVSGINADIKNEFAPYFEYDWVNSSGNFFNRQSTEMNGPFFTMMAVDLNCDNSPEIILSQKYSDRTAQINDIFTSENNEIEYKASFYGDLGESIKLYEDRQTGKKYFPTINSVYQNQTQTETVSLCVFSDNFEDFTCVPKLSESTADDKTVFRIYKEECLLSSVWLWSENEELTEEINESAYNLETENLYNNLSLVKECRAFKSERLVFNRFEDTDEPLYSSKEDVDRELVSILGSFVSDSGENGVETEGNIDFSVLEEQLGYDICDKNDKNYLYAKERCEEWYSEEELAEYEKRNYFEEIVFHPYYLGTEQADWFVEAWWFYGRSEMSSYIDFLIIKDGEIVRRTGALPIRGTINEKWDKKDFFRPAGKDGVVRYNFETGEIEYIGDEFVTTDIADQSRVLDLNESYVLIYIFEHLYIYDRNTRECMDTGLDFYAMTMARARLEDDKIYWQDNTGGNKLIYYIKTGEIVYDDSISVEIDY